MSEKNKVQSSHMGGNDEIDLGRLIGTLLDHRWLIIGITSLFAVIGIIYTLFATPIYKADAMVQVESTVGNAIMDNLDSIMPGGKPGSDAEIQLIQSRMVLGKTVADLNLDTQVQEHHFPVFGSGWARITGQKPAQIAVSRFNVPTIWMNKPMELEMVDSKHFVLSTDDGEVLKGEVGKLATEGEFSLLVSDVKAEPGTRFDIVKRPEISAIKQIQNQLVIEDAGRDTGVLNLSLTGADPELTQKTLASVANNYLMQNVERKSAEAEKSLNFLRVQLPEVRSKLDAAEDKLNRYRQQNASVDMSLETKALLDQMVGLEGQLNELTFREAEISKLYTKSHPAYRTLLEKRQTLESERNNLNKRVSSMPETQQEILRLTRDVQAGQEVYMQLLNKQQELSITKASTVGNVRIVDNALTQPGVVKPQKILIVIIAIMLGLIVSIFWIVVKIMLYRGIESPSVLEEAGINVYASIPLSEWQQKKDREIFAGNLKNAKRKEQAAGVLAIGNPTDLAVEAVRSLRTSLHFAMLEAKNNILMISGASPSIGKTFVCTNLAVVVAQTAKRVLIIDGDMRKGYTHDLLGVPNNSGLSDILSGQSSIQNAVKSAGVANFDIITRGKVPPNPSELLMHERFDELLAWASANYDIVLIDTPPVLAVTDAAIVGRKAGTALMVARYGVNTLKEIEVSINRFEQNGIEIKGVILNSVIKKASNYYGDYGYYEYEYKSAKQ